MMAGNKFESVSHNLLHVQQFILFKLDVEITLDKVHFPFFMTRAFVLYLKKIF